VWVKLKDSLLVYHSVWLMAGLSMKFEPHQSYPQLKNHMIQIESDVLSMKCEPHQSYPQLKNHMIQIESDVHVWLLSSLS